MWFPLSLWDISLWLAVSAIILLVASELTFSLSRKTNLVVEKKRLRSVALLVGLLFLITVIVRIYEMLVVSFT